jgi:hypothetical protein
MGWGRRGNLNEEEIYLISFREFIDGSDDAFLHDGRSKIEEVSKFLTREPQVCLNLFSM